MRYLVLEKNYFKNKKRKEVHFHDWCIDEDWKKLNQNVLSEFIKNRICKYPWENKKKFKADYKYITKLTNKLLKEIIIDINKFHNLNYSNEYWKIILFPWLKSVVVLFYDRWQMISNIKKKNLIFCIYNYRNLNFIPERYADLNSQSKDFNFWIVTEIVKYKKNIKFIKENAPSVKKYKDNSTRKHKRLSKVYKYLFKFFSQIFKCKFFIHDIGLTKLETLFLNIKLFQFPFFWIEPEYKQEKINLEKRKKFFYKEKKKFRGK